MSEFRVRITADGDVQKVVSVAIGRPALDLVGTAAAADQAVELAATKQPDLLLLDLDRIGHGTDVVPRVREAAPGTKVVVVSGRDETSLVPAALGAGAQGYVTRTITRERLVKELVALVSGAVAEAATALEPTPASAGQARRFVGAALHGWGRDDDQEVVGLLVSELVGNAIRHSASNVEVAIHLLPDGLRVEVHDSAEGLPVIVEAGPDAERGRGLALVDALAGAWGVETHEGDGKDVWFELLR